MESLDHNRIDGHQSSVKPRVWRSRDNKVIAGVVGGLAERLNVNPTMLRWFAAFAALFTGFFPLGFVYLLLWAVASEYPSANTSR